MAHAAQDARVADAVAIPDQAYVYGYPLLLGEAHRLQMSNVARPTGMRAPANSFWHARRLASPGEHHPLVSDTDTLASLAWLDLGPGAVLFAYPDMGRRWFGITLHSLWMPALATLGSASGDGRSARLLISGPGWQGSVPKGVRHLRSPTRFVALLGRMQTSGSEADLRAVRALQAQMRLVPQGPRTQAGGAPAASAEPVPAIGPGDAPRQVVQAMDTTQYFGQLARLLGTAAPPAAEDAPLLAKMARIGLEPGKTFRMEALEPAVQAALQGTPVRAMQRIAAYRPQLFATVGSWQVQQASGDFGIDYLKRAAVAAAGWPGTQPQQMLEMSTDVDADGKALSGAHDYLLRFDKGRLPPVDGFWSLTLQAVDHGRRSFVPNSADRFSLGTRDKLRPDAEGALKLQVQNLSPGIDHAAGWLPAPKGAFVLTLRLYAPRTTPPAALPPGQGGWLPPPLRRQ